MRKIKPGRSRLISGKKNLFFIWRVLFTGLAIVMVAGCQLHYPDPDNQDDDEIDNIYKVFDMVIDVENNAPVVSKEPEDYLNCTVTIDGKGVLDDYEGTARIRGRGNSSWEWYDKKPYRIKLDEKSEILGLKSNSDWVLLANYRDPTDLMNTFGFEVASILGLPYTNHTRYVEVTLNGDYIGLYQLTEQVEHGSNRVDVDDIDGLLISLDADDGPYYSPDESDNFWSSVFDMPVCVKYPEYLSSSQLSAVSDDFAILEDAINNFDYETVDSLMDIGSLIDYLIVEELVYNVEIDAPRSVFLFKDKGGKYVMGPVWDFDAGFDFDWGTMYTGHNYFNAQELVLGTDPANHTNGYRVPGFFTQMFRNSEFVLEYKARWNEVKDYILEDSWAVMEEYIVCLQEALERDYQRWPIDKNYATETDRMEEWLTERLPYLTNVINDYPEGGQPTTKTDCGLITCDVTMSFMAGYNQSVYVEVNEATLLSMLDITREQLYGNNLRIVPLKTDGTEGENNTNGTFGGWFEADNNPGVWSNGHVYIEIFDNLTEWNCGLRNDEGYCSVGDNHTVRMQYQYTQNATAKTVTVVVNFTIAE